MAKSVFFCFFLLIWSLTGAPPLLMLGCCVSGRPRWGTHVAQYCLSIAHVDLWICNCFTYAFVYIGSLNHFFFCFFFVKHKKSIFRKVFNGFRHGDCSSCVCFGFDNSRNPKRLNLYTLFVVYVAIFFDSLNKKIQSFTWAVSYKSYQLQWLCSRNRALQTRECRLLWR